MSEKQVKKLFYRILNRKPGHRFIYIYTRINHFFNQNMFTKIMCFIVGLGLIGVGIVLLFIPGPGILFILLGSALLCVASKHIAMWFDTIEKKAHESFKERR